MTATANTALVIEKGVPIPQKGTQTGVTATLRAMTPGDSTVVETINPTNIYNIARHAAVKVTVRKEGVGSYRVWRTA